MKKSYFGFGKLRNQRKGSEMTDLLGAASFFSEKEKLYRKSVYDAYAIISERLILDGAFEKARILLDEMDRYVNGEPYSFDSFENDLPDPLVGP